MSTDDHGQAVPLDLILGPHLAATVIRRAATALQRDDFLPEPVALRLACERATDGDPLVLAAPGQIWELREDVDPDDAPARRLAIHLRLTSPPTVYVSDPDDPTGDGEIDELLLEVLHLYTLASWDIRFLVAPTAIG
ncbi:hypothetical protein ACIG0C_30315 [Kitasatospora aureofaciens]|uniref:Uncharacterized protein n=1 Tax=Kitasatospora aureofaciens TaxID=1894 RepID=A0A1E7NE91_KITAU|nr:hypothetical protein [Kitasatospora aureofaciens]ARF83249.1 hypothetical protein B6264_30380 [Kitasatospora aureofaciens]OEV39019.1 hypothetical protein HS99_0018110 [Kitasatospora aureofaciens]GGU99567.1 hypothetical protein GCM10010502_62570 [Kitasatospora aureofaciens]